MRYVVCVPDGCADEPSRLLGGRTPLEVAAMPTLAKLAARGLLGRAAVIPAGMPPGSDVGNMSIFGYDPARYHTGRAPIEAAALGLRLGPDEVAYRCNLVTIGDDATMVDFAGGHPTSAEAAPIIEALDREMGGEVRFHPGVEYRHVMVAPAALADADCIPPHDLTDRPVRWPIGPAAPRLHEIMATGREIVAGFGLAANAIWLWGQGHQPQMPSFAEQYGVQAGLSSAVDLVRGLGMLTGIEVHDVAGVTAGYDNDYRAQRDAALAALGDGCELFIVHVEASDEAGHAGDADEKVRSLERWDAEILEGLIEGLDAMGPWRLLLLPDHATPLDLKTHTAEPVPYLLVDSAVDGPGGRYIESAVAGEPVLPGHELMGRLLEAR